MKKVILFFVLLLITTTISAQDNKPLHWAVMPTFGLTQYGNAYPLTDSWTAGLKADYYFFLNTKAYIIELEGVYGFGQKSLYNANISFGIRFGKISVANFEWLLGVGYQYIDGIGDMRLTMPSKFRLMFPITKNFGFGIEGGLAITNNSTAIVSSTGTLLVSFRF